MQQTGERSLVIMTNGDTYYLKPTDFEALLEALLETNSNTDTFAFTDAKSGATVALRLRHVSSVVRETNRG